MDAESEIRECKHASVVVVMVNRSCLGVIEKSVHISIYPKIHLDF